MTQVPNGVETLPKISTTWVGCTNVTDDRQTDGRRHIANVRFHQEFFVTISNMSSYHRMFATWRWENCSHTYSHRLWSYNHTALYSMCNFPTKYLVLFQWSSTAPSHVCRSSVRLRKTRPLKHLTQQYWNQRLNRFDVTQFWDHYSYI